MNAEEFAAVASCLVASCAGAAVEQTLAIMSRLDRVSLLIAVALVSGCAKSHLRSDDSGIVVLDAETVRPADGGQPEPDAGVPREPGEEPPDGGASPWQYGIAAPVCPYRTPGSREWIVVVSDSLVTCEQNPRWARPFDEGTALRFWFWGDLSERTYVLEPFPFGDASLVLMHASSPSAEHIREGTLVVERFTRDGEVVLQWSATLEDGGRSEGRARVVMFCPGSPRWPHC